MSGLRRKERGSGGVALVERTSFPLKKREKREPKRREMEERKWGGKGVMSSRGCPFAEKKHH